MKKTTIYLIISVILLIILFPIVFYPPTGDFAIYIKGGQVLFNGGRLYVDFIDVKSPLFFMISGLLGLFSGNTYTGFRIVEYFFHFFVSFLLFYEMKKITKTEIAIISSIIYSISILVINFDGTYESETVSNLFIILLIFQLIKSKDEAQKNKFSSFYITGILSGILFSMKLTYLIIPLSFLIIDIFDYSPKKKIIKPYVIIFFSFVLSTLFCHIFLIDKQVFDGYLRILNYIKFYSNIPPISLDFIKITIKSIGNYFGYFFSLFFSFTVLLTIFLLLIQNKSENPGVKKENFSNDIISDEMKLFQDKRITKLLYYSISFLILLLISIIIERKYFFYHYSRLIVPLSILSSFGIYIIWQNIKQYFTARNKFSKIIAIIILSAFLFIFSPITRVISQWQYPLKKLQGNEKYFAYIEKISSEILSYSDKYTITKYVNKNYSNSTKILISANGSFDISFFLNGHVINSFAQSCYYISNFRVPYYINKFRNELKSANLLIIQNNDRNYAYNNHQMSSYEALFQSADFKDYLINNFKQVYETKELLLFERKK